MSRLIVKNIPPGVNGDRFREHFETARLGTITDARLAYKRDGSFRHFGFLGFKTPAEASKAKEYFDNTFFGAARIQVEVVDITKSREGTSIHPIKRPRVEEEGRTRPEAGPSSSTTTSKTPQRNPKLSVKEDAVAKVSTSKNGKSLVGKEEQLNKFLALMGPRHNVRAWGNEDDFGRNEEQTSATAMVAPLEMDTRSSPSPRPDVDLGLSDAEWLRMRMKGTSHQVELDSGLPHEKVFEQSDDEDVVMDAEPRNPKPESEPDTGYHEKELERTRNHILETGRLFLRNLTFSCTEDDLRNAFAPYGDIEQIHIPLDSRTRHPKGVAYVRFVKPADAANAFEAMDGKDLQGRLLHVLAAVDKRPPRTTEEPSRKKSLKETVLDKRKANAGKEFNWAMLYMNSDAVVASVADRMNLSKADILNAEAGTANPAVKLALAETHVIQETKKYLEDNGIVLDAFEFGKAKRSDSTILVKNIPYGTTSEDLQQIFGMHGEVARLLIPPAGTMAVVDFNHPDEARKAFRGVSYKRLRNSIIYLEWAPLGVFSATAKDESTVDTGIQSVLAPKGVDAAVVDDSRKYGPPETTEGSTLFVKNLNFATTVDRVTTAFKGLPGFTFARVNTKPDPKDANGRLSMGYGFIGFETAEQAQNALKTIQGYVLDGHALLVNFAKRGTDDAVSSKERAIGMGTAKTSKIIVRNVPFEASKKDLKALFGAHGTLKSVRLPKKFDARSRGFAFLEFVSRREAENAMTTLKHTHLLGRHLVLEWAKESEVVDVDELRDKIKKGFVEDGRLLPGQKRKFRVDGEDGAEQDFIEI